MTRFTDPRLLFAYDDGTPTPPCRMCGRPRRRQNIGMGARESLAMYCGTKGCEALERICQRPGCGRRFSVGPGASKYCPEHSRVLLEVV